MLVQPVHISYESRGCESYANMADLATEYSSFAVRNETLDDSIQVYLC
jgi:hypothetical protein